MGGSKVDRRAFFGAAVGAASLPLVPAAVRERPSCVHSFITTSPTHFVPAAGWIRLKNLNHQDNVREHGDIAFGNEDVDAYKVHPGEELQAFTAGTRIYARGRGTLMVQYIKSPRTLTE